MRKLSLILVLLHIICMQSLANPHGKDLKIRCDACHNSDGWKLDKNNISFSHNSTPFLLEGMHKEVSCLSCHPTLVFSEAKQDCLSCHADIHQQSVGSDCINCHTPKSWIVENITSIHQLSRFPLLGPHATADCSDCHLSASLLRFDPIGVECIDCHQEEYFFTTNPNHIESGFSTDCMDCHKMNSFAWTGSSFTHAFFPLTLGHSITDCRACHTNGNDYSTLTSDCFTCHQTDYTNTTNPNHAQADLSSTCTDCHTTNPGWKPADFNQHDNIFPIYSGKHNGEWQSCTDCHTNASNYSLFSCIDCHEHNQSDMNAKHQGVGGYLYSSTSCFECHPNGSGEGGFNHNASNFPLTGAHSNTACLSCHSTGYSGTSTYCYDCHTSDFNQTTNPNHIEIGLAHDCDDCHTSNPGWNPALFTIHNNYYPLLGAHINADCISCHTSGYTATPNLCIDCHSTNYDQTTNPPHLSSQFSTECLDCHTETAWKPSTFNHSEYYTLTGAHLTTDCISCHTNGYTSTPNLCIDCHLANYNQTTNPNHTTVGFTTDCETCHTTNPAWTPTTFNHSNYYVIEGAHTAIANDCNACHNENYTTTPNTCVGCHQNDYNQTSNPPHVSEQFSTECLDCHTQTAWIPSTINHSSFYPLTGAHTTTSCNSCHTNGYTSTPNLCIDCHLANYNQTTNPNHTTVGFSTDCESCHTTNPGWAPATFNHNNFYVIAGAHTAIANDCNACHNGNYTTTPNTCVGCHQNDYNQTSNPPHLASQFSTDCLDCHTENAWKPATFDHDAQYFPIYSGKHNGEWSSCIDCHTTPSNYALFSCINCHEHNKTDMDDEHRGTSGYSYNSTACLNCHPTGRAED